MIKFVYLYIYTNLISIREFNDIFLIDNSINI